MADDDDDDDVLLLTATYCVLRLRRIQRKKRRFWVHPVAANREQQGDYGNLILELRADQVLFPRYFRMCVSQFDEIEILSIIGPSIQLENTRWRSSIDPEQQLAICLRFIYFSTN